ncbi:TetR family transcriptional regulator [Nocardioides sp. AX2bis]|uniref:TetR family transcriptional regulator n=1 Tax=Nocardioides sp. AX2bis TaxID=2653157 RepID=UPI0012F04043|nr:TetR family transcriptional regulator [Nocardioides sp. AX2bis]VXC34935.1 Transcriptional regulator, TetR family [Nocardioides sp. AX2bis]
MVRDGDASRRRLLAAATAEFAAHGLAGARVDRIAAAAEVNKQQMYAWHGSKDGLFDAVFAAQLERIVDAVPFTAHDLPGYAVALYDSYLTDPEIIRLVGWNRLERVPVGDLLAGHGALTEPKRAALEQAQHDGLVVDGIAPGDVYAMVIGIAGSWSPLSGTVTAAPGDDEADHDRRRTALRHTVARALVPSPR